MLDTSRLFILAHRMSWDRGMQLRRHATPAARSSSITVPTVPHAAIGLKCHGDNQESLIIFLLFHNHYAKVLEIFDANPTCPRKWLVGSGHPAAPGPGTEVLYCLFFRKGSGCFWYAVRFLVLTFVPWNLSLVNVYLCRSPLWHATHTSYGLCMCFNYRRHDLFDIT